ncbi:MAG: tRNA 5-methoxyuridine(34)/uridine 5-oxyacetic acid(34) synthase CmoB [Bdellovibrionales bacterium]|nr:tRNA 5-methoxyuridine(34)/uridine 5-oxyacetic acid(34) synthase CmoB [Bdellovibrionales bacterium]
MLEEYSRFFDSEQLQRIRKEQEESLLHIDHWDRHRERLLQFSPPPRSELSIRDEDIFAIRAAPELEAEYAECIGEMVRGLLPWRKGPFNLLGIEIDAEWRSDLKWNRLAPFLPDLRGKRIADVGCNNGYYMMRMLKYDPQLIAGFDPSGRCLYQFDLFQRFLRDDRLVFELLGIEHMHVFPEFFDCVLCLGVIYHRRDPFTSCRMLFECMRPGGTVFLESLVIPGEEPTALCVPGRYAKMRNVWFIPTVSCLGVWLEKAGFTDVEVVSTGMVTIEEQRRTPLAPYESLVDFLDPNDHTKTIEGYHAPTRSILKAYRP